MIGLIEAKVMCFHRPITPSIKITICSSKPLLRKLVPTKDDEKSIEVALEFDRIGNRIDDLIFEQANEWTQKMILK